jgi:hypothetical protein
VKAKKTGQMAKKGSEVLYSELECNDANTRKKIGAKLLSKGLLARGGGDEASNTCERELLWKTRGMPTSEYGRRDRDR